ncbi:DUF1348 family protein [Roseateles sp. BYS78W]|uniref:DUF1348 family protein n=1 Tax=Pelomonas candidula TaxID=3299025 RepID=A0ABW7HJB3_9BURK
MPLIVVGPSRRHLTPTPISHLPPFTRDTAVHKICLAEESWNRRDPGRAVLAYGPDSVSRNNDELLRGRAEAQALLEREWARELDCHCIREC